MPQGTAGTGEDRIAPCIAGNSCAGRGGRPRRARTRMAGAADGAADLRAERSRSRWTRALQAEAFAASGRIVSVGTTAAIRSRVGSSTQTIDAKQMTIVPGHRHAQSRRRRDATLRGARVGNPFEVEFVTIASIIESCARRQRPAGFGSRGTSTTTRLKTRPLNVRDLDQVSTTHLVVVHHRGGHTGFYNSRSSNWRATKATPNPPGGTFDRDANGDLNGRVTDTARTAGVRPAAVVYDGAVGAAQRDGLAHTNSSSATASPACTTPAAIWRRYGRAHARRPAPPRELRTLRRHVEPADRRGNEEREGDEWIKWRHERTRLRFVPERDGDERGQHRPASRQRTESQDTLNAWVERASRRHPGEPPRQRRRGDRHVSHRTRARSSCSRATQPKISTARSSTTIWCAITSSRRAGRVHDLRLLQQRQVSLAKRMKRSLAFRTFLDAVSTSRPDQTLRPVHLRR